SGPHFFVGSPFYKTPRAECTENSHYDILDLQTLPDDYLPRTNYIPACGPAIYRDRTPRVSWLEWEQQPLVNSRGEELIGPPAPFYRKVTEYYRLVNREMVGSSSERTLTTTIAP